MRTKMQGNRICTQLLHDEEAPLLVLEVVPRAENRDGYLGIIILVLAHGPPPIPTLFKLFFNMVPESASCRVFVLSASLL